MIIRFGMPLFLSASILCGHVIAVDAVYDLQKIADKVVETGEYCGPLTIHGRFLIFGMNSRRANGARVFAKQDTGLMVCVDHETRKVVWRSIHPSLEKTESDHPQYGIQSKAVVSGGRVFYTSNAGELMCVDLDGFHDLRDDGIQSKVPPSQNDVDVVWRLSMIDELGVYKRAGHDLSLIHISEPTRPY